MGSSLSTRITYRFGRASQAHFILTSVLALAFTGQAVADKNAFNERSGEEHPPREAPPEIISVPPVEPAPGIPPPYTLNPITPDPVAPNPVTPVQDDGLDQGTLDKEADSQQVSTQDVGADQSVGKDTCPADTLWLRGDFGRARFSVDVADTRQSRAQGLMHVEYMPSSKGMLFVYDYPQEVAFWMKNTLIPLDIIYADDRGVVSSVQANAIPGDQTPLPGEGLIQYVLEINGGLAAKLGIEPGNEIQHPAIVAPIWPCE
ncbi:DUF192 domain-containing protein [uncultured Pelagimonas sp.]|uniref:DUF192 domain-containing protein n=1 Tax=uncultured Pelagimonas sp. TaxID=1618102 RepID=UPI003446C727